MDERAQPLPVDTGPPALTGDDMSEVDRAEDAALPGAQRNLAARVRRLEAAERRQRIRAGDGVDEHQPRIAAAPGGVHDTVEHLARAQPADRPLPARVNEIVGRPVLDGVHERVGDADRQVEVLQGAAVDLGLDEVQDVGMVDAQDAHVRSAAASALLDVLRRGI